MVLSPGAHRAAFSVDPAWTFLNHGSFGATPRVVQAARRRWLDRMEAQPVRFLVRELPELLPPLRARFASFLGADADGLVFVPNATTGIAAALASLSLPRGALVLTTDHRYQAVHEAVTAALAPAAGSVELLPVPRVANDDPAAVVAAFSERLQGGPSPDLLVLSWITSPTALVLPAQELVALARRHGVPVLLDGAHTPGHIPVDLAAIAPDFWVGNLHKWLCAPKGSALLWVHPRHRDRVHCLSVSHGRGQGLHAEFDWPGTFDPSPWLAAGAALDLHEEWGGSEVQRASRALAQDALQLIVSAGVGAEPVAVPGSPMACAMATVRLPLPGDQAPALMEALHRRRIEVPVFRWWTDSFLRISAFAPFSRLDDHARLAAVLPVALAEARAQPPVA